MTRALGRPAAHNDISTARPDDVAIVQALELLNGEEFYDRIYSSSIADQLASQKDLAKVMDRLYLVALSRPASSEEQKLGTDFLKASLPKQAANKSQSSSFGLTMTCLPQPRRAARAKLRPGNGFQLPMASS